MKLYGVTTAHNVEALIPYVRQKFLEQQNDYASENVMMGYVGDLGQDIYDNSMLGCSFPLEMYFCLKQFNSARGSIEGMFNHETGERV